MRRFITIFTALLLLHLGGFAQGIIFETGTFAEVLEKAQKENKLVFVDFYTDWCGPCKKMTSDVFLRDNVGEFFNAQFINYKIDAEKGEGPKLAKKYNVSAYPTMFFLNPDGSAVHKLVGAKDEDKFMEEARGLGKAAKYGGMFKMREEYNNGRSDEPFLKDFFTFQPPNEKIRAEIAERYILNISEEKFMSEESDDIVFISGDNNIFKWLQNWNDDVMYRILDMLEKKSSKSGTEDAGKDGELKNLQRFSSGYSIGVVFGVEQLGKRFIQQAIDNNDEQLLENCIKFQQAFRRRLNRLVNGDGDVNIFSGRGIFFASPEFIRLAFMAKNRNNPEQFKAEIIPYMEKIIDENPIDSVKLMIPRNKEDKSRYDSNRGALQVFFYNVLREHNISINTFISFANYYWRIMPNDKKTKATIAKWLNYAVALNPYYTDGEKKATPLLIKIGHRKDAISNLQLSVDLLNKYAPDPAKYTKELEDMIEDIKNDKI